MNYTLAKELKDAGFPQGDDYYVTEDGQSGSGLNTDLMQGFLVAIGDTREFTYIPYLHELIEACGGLFRHLALADDGKWMAHGVFFSGVSHIEEGPTPIIAVARLWLALNSSHDKKD